MMQWLAYAERTDFTGGDWSVILWDVGVVAGVAVLTTVPVALAWRHRFGGAITAATLAWALLSAGTVMVAIHAHARWSAERMDRIKSGYFDPADMTGAPPWPWVWWCLLGGAYVIMLAWLLLKHSRDDLKAG